MTDQEKAVIEAAKACPRILYWNANATSYTIPDEYARLLQSVQALEASERRFTAKLAADTWPSVYDGGASIASCVSLEWAVCIANILDKHYGKP